MNEEKGFEINLSVRQTMVTKGISKVIWILKIKLQSIEKLYKL